MTTRIRRIRRGRLVAVAVSAVTLAAVASGLTMQAAAGAPLRLDVAGAAAVGTPTPVMTGLDAPRGLAFARNGALYVVEAGRGGTGPCTLLRPGVTACYGPTGRISRLWRGLQSTVVTGLPSAVMTTGADGATVGPHDIDVQGGGRGVITIGWGGNPALRDTPTTLSGSSSGTWPSSS